MSHGVAIKGEVISQVIALILARKRVEKVVIFGSRAGVEFSRTSDIDIAIFGREWTGTDINIVKDRIEESVKTPLKFDIVNFYSIRKKGLRDEILKNGKVIYDAKKGS